MITLLLTILLASIIIGGIAILILVLFGLGTIALFVIKILMAIGLVYLGIKVLLNLFK